MRRRFAARCASVIVWPRDEVGDIELLALRAVAPCCAACRYGRFKEVLPVFTEFFRDL